MIQTGDFGKRVRTDVEVVRKLIHAVRPEPKERLFGFGLRSWSATLDVSFQ